MAGPIYITSNSAEQLAFIICSFFNDGHSVGCEMVPHCSFDLHLSDN